MAWRLTWSEAVPNCPTDRLCSGLDGAGGRESALQVRQTIPAIIIGYTSYLERPTRVLLSKTEGHISGILGRINYMVIRMVKHLVALPFVL